MKAFSQLYQTLDQTTSTNAKVAAMSAYFDEAPARDAAWAVYFLSGRRLKRLVGAARLREWLIDMSDLPAWLVEETYASVGDLAETIALLLSRPKLDLDTLSLADWVEQRLLPLRGIDAEEQRPQVTAWWSGQSYESCYIVTKLLTGALRVGVSQTLLARAVAEHAGLERAVILHRLMGEWTPDAEYWQALIAADDGQAALSRPFPFCLAAPLEAESQTLDETLGDVSAWLAEWKWDGIRSQLVRRGGETFLWSRGEELIGERFPEITAMAEHLVDGTVLDGEILPWNAEGVMPFAELQRRIGRKQVGKKLLKDVPCRFLAYDLLEHHGEDLRDQPLSVRRTLLEDTVRTALSVMADAAVRAGDESSARLALSSTLPSLNWKDLATLREDSRARGVEGLMLKSLDSPYGTGRKRGTWWKWKIDPYTVDAVMIYAQAGHGRRANLFTDYTFAVWDGDRLVPVAKAYSGLDNAEIGRLDKWIRRHTRERFGPVRSVEPVHVFELAFEGINLSTRHKSGIAVRFPRISRWRHDLAPKDADSLESVKRLIAAPVRSGGTGESADEDSKGRPSRQQVT